MTSELTFVIHNGQDLKRAFREEVAIAQGGLLGTVAPFIMWGFYWEMWWTCLIWIIILMVYTVVEVGRVFEKNYLEDIGELVFLRK